MPTFVGQRFPCEKQNKSKTKHFHDLSLELCVMRAYELCALIRHVCERTHNQYIKLWYASCAFTWEKYEFPFHQDHMCALQNRMHILFEFFSIISYNEPNNFLVDVPFLHNKIEMEWNYINCYGDFLPLWSLKQNNAKIILLIMFFTISQNLTPELFC